MGMESGGAQGLDGFMADGAREALVAMVIEVASLVIAQAPDPAGAYRDLVLRMTGRCADQAAEHGESARTEGFRDMADFLVERIAPRAITPAPRAD